MAETQLFSPQFKQRPQCKDPHQFKIWEGGLKNPLIPSKPNLNKDIWVEGCPPPLQSLFYLKRQVWLSSSSLAHPSQDPWAEAQILIKNQNRSIFWKIWRRTSGKKLKFKYFKKIRRDMLSLKKIKTNRKLLKQWNRASICMTKHKNKSNCTFQRQSQMTAAREYYQVLPNQMMKR